MEVQNNTNMNSFQNNNQVGQQQYSQQFNAQSQYQQENQTYNQRKNQEMKPEFFVKPNKFVCFIDSFIISIIPFTLLYIFFLILRNILAIEIEPYYLIIIQFVLAFCVIIFMILSFNKKSSYEIQLYDNYINILLNNKLIERINYVFITGITYEDDYIDKIFRSNSIKLNDIVAIRHVKNGDKLVQFINYLYQYNMRYYRQ